MTQMEKQYHKLLSTDDTLYKLLSTDDTHYISSYHYDIKSNSNGEALRGRRALRPRQHRRHSPHGNGQVCHRLTFGQKSARNVHVEFMNGTMRACYIECCSCGRHLSGRAKPRT